MLEHEAVPINEKEQEKDVPENATPDTIMNKSDSISKGDTNRQAIQKEYLRTIVYYFHYADRDAACRRLERLTAQSLYANFKNQLASGRLIWRSVNIDDPRSSHFADDFKLTKRSIVIITPAVKRDIKWKILDDAEKLAGDEAGYLKYIKNEVSAFVF